MIEKPDSGRDVDDLLRCRAWLAIKIDVHFDLCFVCIAGDVRGAITTHGGRALCGAWSLACVERKKDRQIVQPESV